MITRSTSFNDEFKFFLNKFKRKENFNLLRFSDRAIHNAWKIVSLGIFVSVGGRLRGIVFHNKWDRKTFIPKQIKSL